MTKEHWRIRSWHTHGYTRLPTWRYSSVDWGNHLTLTPCSRFPLGLRSRWGSLMTREWKGNSELAERKGREGLRRIRERRRVGERMQKSSRCYLSRVRRVEILISIHPYSRRRRWTQWRVAQTYWSLSRRCISVSRQSWQRSRPRRGT